MDGIANQSSSADGASQSQTDQKPPRFNKVPHMLRDTKDFEKLYEPRFVSIGPYHHGKPYLQQVQNLKDKFANKFVSNDQQKRIVLKDKLLEKIKEVRECYVENLKPEIDDEELAEMMLLDGCFILYYIKCVVGEKIDKHDLEMKGHVIAFVGQDLFLLENQIPFFVLRVLIMNNSESENNNSENGNSENSSSMKNSDNNSKNNLRCSLSCSLSCSPGCCFSCSSSSCLITNNSDNNSKNNPKNNPKNERETLTKEQWIQKINLFIQKYIMAPQSKEKKQVQPLDYETERPAHLLELLHRRMVPPVYYRYIRPKLVRFTFRSLKELTAVGIHLKPEDTDRMTEISYDCPNATLKIPSITVDESTRSKLLNLIAYEMCPDAESELEVTNYICFMDSLIDNPEDVKKLRSAQIAASTATKM